MKKPRKASKRTKKAAATAAAPEPVTLAQVKAMLNAKPAPRRSLGAKVGVAQASAGSVAIERKKLIIQRRLDNKARVHDYKAMMEIMKKRGVKGLASKTVDAPKRRAPGAAKAPSTAPLQIFAEGDSWFDYPVPFFGGGVIPRLEDRLGVPILNLAKAGDEVRFMLGVEERKILEKQLRQGCPAGGLWDVLLFSGGGNDIVDKPMALWVRDFNPSVPSAKLIHQTRYDAALALVQAGYEDLIALRDELSPDTHLVFHAYDFAIPDGRGICHLGPWMKPTFDLRKFPSASTSAFEVVKEMLTQLATMLTTLERNHNRVTFIRSQGTLAPGTSSWHNELHPSKDGFKSFARVFHEKLKAMFPNRVL
ncbi:MAG: hypothetical protein JWM68_4969 [Verrucomicrobiales bacterium]|nr:hypothetical protein [Verrucomicrobiales bacterium]